MSEPHSPRPEAPRRATPRRTRWKALSFSRKPDHGATLYILRCVDGRYFTGVARRTAQDRPGEHPRTLFDNPYIASRRPVTLVHAEHHERGADAFAVRERIKRLARTKKEAYIRGDFPNAAAPPKVRAAGALTAPLLRRSQ